MSPATHSASSYLRLLPAIFSQPEIMARHPFLGNYLKIFEKIMTGLDLGDADPLDGRKGWGQILFPRVIGELFYPRLSFLFPENHSQFIPELTEQSLNTLNQYFGISPTSNAQDVMEWLLELLDFTASWIDLSVYKDYDNLQADNLQADNLPAMLAVLDKMRRIIAGAMPIYRVRGTQEGLQQMIDLFLNLDFRNQPLIRVEVVRHTNTTGWQLGNENTRLRDQYSYGAPIVGGARPWVFLLDITLVCLERQSWTEEFDLDQLDSIPNLKLHIQEAVTRVLHLVDLQKPEYSNYVVHYHPTMMVGSTRLGYNSLLGSKPECTSG